ncbi:hypothetical protein [Ancylobacter polymorphus]|uniref:YARHG domain-containing protein n=1 Tax=Ancylobacter polymorphus TaxID=223390 RepID=A0ABU0BBJ2_9HYPH|nr:hypothetical protein [Ancylobacter polymorphus]MDQ0303201.1 hypothetical protein [Ancylobacter polymorphus]
MKPMFATPALSASAIATSLLLPLPASAQAMPNSLTMSCAQARALVAREGAVVIRTGPDLFDRYVTNPSYCQSQRSRPAWIPTRDDPQCLVGQECRERRIRWR